MYMCGETCVFKAEPSYYHCIIFFICGFSRSRNPHLLSLAVTLLVTCIDEPWKDAFLLLSTLQLRDGVLLRLLLFTHLLLESHVVIVVFHALLLGSLERLLLAALTGRHCVRDALVVS
ncbi:hypothetical protein TraAM80_03897 [Trypanosoma rangeli]|uniref:Uncharacterized protein n=1 Tax=Trypanosoma rangeli TaxID=5698 RepID=A0A3R7LZQ3_TRYRA|nr:uncharacterized protein TraAM80_03897 [Trypanosoma rangeli]RNF06430.1 hypothetical protein TraAM80_03897 [Trypanosoma rangeli]|eukprot:RNF06430.1 hypothetical protein TraAM80_03897 [Trypanosoma rangeli]